MPNGNNFLPQSALPVGQTQMSPIQAPRVGASVPKPMDMSNVFRMQQTIQGNLGIIQNQEALRMRQEQLEINKFQNEMAMADRVNLAMSNAFNQQYESEVARRSGGEGGQGSQFGGLDPSRGGRHATVAKEFQTKINQAHEQSYKLGKDFLASGDKNAAGMLEVVYGINSAARKTRSDMANNEEYQALRFSQTSYDNFMKQMMDVDTKIRAGSPSADGKVINWAEFRKAQIAYQDYVEKGATGSRFPMDKFRVEDYVWDRGVVGDINDLAAKIDAAQTTKNFEEIAVSGGGSLKGERTIRPTGDAVADQLLTLYQRDPNFKAAYDNMAPLDADGKPTMNELEFMRSLITPSVAGKGQHKNMTAMSGSIMNAPAKNNTTSTTTTKVGDPLGNGMYAGPGGRPSYFSDGTGAERKEQQYESSLYNGGYDPRSGHNDDQNSPADIISEIAAFNKGSDGKKTVETIDPENGDKTVWGVVFDPEDDNVEISRRKLGTFHKRESVSVDPSTLNPVNSKVLQDRGLNMKLNPGQHYLSDDALGAVSALKGTPLDDEGISITSTFRDDHKNRSVNGSPTSYHMQGDGFDVDYNSSDGQIGAFLPAKRWFKSDEGKAWLDANNYTVELENEGEKNEHFHFEPKKGTQNANNSSVDNTAIKRVESTILGMTRDVNDVDKAIFDMIEVGTDLSELGISPAKFIDHVGEKGSNILDKEVELSSDVDYDKETEFGRQGTSSVRNKRIDSGDTIKYKDIGTHVDGIDDNIKDLKKARRVLQINEELKNNEIPSEDSLNKLDRIDKKIENLEIQKSNLEDMLYDPDVMSEVTATMLPKQAERSYDSFVNMITTHPGLEEDGIVEIPYSGGYLLEESKYNDGVDDVDKIFYITDPEGNRISYTKSNLRDYVKSNLKTEAFYLSNPVTYYRLELGDLERQREELILGERGSTRNEDADAILNALNINQ